MEGDGRDAVHAAVSLVVRAAQRRAGDLPSVAHHDAVLQVIGKISPFLCENQSSYLLKSAEIVSDAELVRLSMLHKLAESADCGRALAVEGLRYTAQSSPGLQPKRHGIQYHLGNDAAHAASTARGALFSYIACAQGFALAATEAVHRVPISGSDAVHSAQFDGPTPLQIALSMHGSPISEAGTVAASSMDVTVMARSHMKPVWQAVPVTASNGQWSGRWRLQFSALASLAVAIEAVTPDGEAIVLSRSKSLAADLLSTTAGGAGRASTSTAAPQASNGGTPADGVRPHLPADLSAGTSASCPSSARLFAVVRCVTVRSVAPEGHTLAVQVPLLPQGTQSSASQADGSSVVDIYFLDEGLKGVRDVICPTHDVQITPTGAAGTSGGHTARHTAATVNNGNTSYSRHVRLHIGQKSAHYGPQHFGLLDRSAILLIEPGNAVTSWDGLVSDVDSAGHGSGSAVGSIPMLPRPLAAPLPSQLPRGLLGWLQGPVHDRPAPAGGSVLSHHLQPTATPGSTAPAPAAPLPAPALLSTDASALPRHIAIVMDGNGRWAKARGLGRSAGHRAGVNTIHAVIRSCRRLRIPYLTLYAFSAQNWSRPPAEVSILMQLLDEFVATDLHELTDNGVRLQVLGEIEKLPHKARTGLQRMIESSQHNTGLTLTLALSYGGREEVAAAAASAAQAAAAGLVSPSALCDPAVFRRFMPCPDMPDPDLLIRTSGELRLSNFLLWHVAYTELYVTNVLWPDFDDAELGKALASFASRERRFGKTSEQVVAEGPKAGAASQPSALASIPKARHIIVAGRGGWAGPRLLWYVTTLPTRWALSLAIATAVALYLTICGARPPALSGILLPVGRVIYRSRAADVLLRGLPTSQLPPHASSQHTWEAQGGHGPPYVMDGQVEQSEHAVSSAAPVSDTCVLWDSAPPSANATTLEFTHTPGCNFSGWTRAGAATSPWEGGRAEQPWAEVVRAPAGPPVTRQASPAIPSGAPVSQHGRVLSLPTIHDYWPLSAPSDDGTDSASALDGGPPSYLSHLTGLPESLATMTPWTFPAAPGPFGDGAGIGHGQRGLHGFKIRSSLAFAADATGAPLRQPRDDDGWLGADRTAGHGPSHVTSQGKRDDGSADVEQAGARKQRGRAHP